MDITNSMVFAALAEPNRLNIVDMLSRRGELSASLISRSFSCTPSAISQHLKVLAKAGIVRVEKRGQQRIYSLEPRPIVEAQHWLEQRTTLWNAKLDAIENYVK